MKPTSEILERIEKCSSEHKDGVFTRLYRYLLREDIYYAAYQKLYANKGATTQGIDDDTADGFSDFYVKELIQSLKDGTYKAILRMYFSSVDKQRQAIEQAPDYIQQAFTGDYGACKHCHNMKEDSSCSHRKSYTIHGKQYEFCDGFAFWFFSPDLARIPEYIKLFLAFYPEKRKK